MNEVSLMAQAGLDPARSLPGRVDRDGERGVRPAGGSVTVVVKPPPQPLDLQFGFVDSERLPITVGFSAMLSALLLWTPGFKPIHMTLKTARRHGHREVR